MNYAMLPSVPLKALVILSLTSSLSPRIWVIVIRLVEVSFNIHHIEQKINEETLRRIWLYGEVWENVGSNLPPV